MSKLLKIFAVLSLLTGAVAIVPTAANAQYYHHHHGGWRGGGYGWGPAFGFGFGLGYARPYYGYGSYYGGYYAPPPRCGYVRMRVWRNGYWVLRRAWRCW